MLEEVSFEDVSLLDYKQKPIWVLLKPVRPTCWTRFKQVFSSLCCFSNDSAS